MRLYHHIVEFQRVFHKYSKNAFMGSIILDIGVQIPRWLLGRYSRLNHNNV
jgi:hypothetical protein